MKCKYPILLVHGFVLKDVWFFSAFGKIPVELRKAGYVVYTSNNDGIGTIENNAKQLKKQINKILKKEKVDKINIIAHSKGGLDSKYMITELNMEDKIASLTTICTPHKGSQIADKILSSPKWVLKPLILLFNSFYKILGDQKPDVLKSGQQLQTSGDLTNKTINFSSKVYCQSYSAVLKNSKDDFLMAIPYIFSKKYEKTASDGLVSQASSKFGKYKGVCIEDSISHTEIVDLMTNKSEKEKVYKFYKNICKGLAKKGF